MSGRPGVRGLGSSPASDPKKVSGELFSLTYGALVAQILKDYESVDDVNKQLDRMGYNIGVRIVEDFLSRTSGSSSASSVPSSTSGLISAGSSASLVGSSSGSGRCGDFRETSEKIQQAFKLYLNVSPTVTSWSSAADEFSLIFDANPLAEFVELPDNCYNLRYANLLAGAIRGALEMVHLEVTCWFVQDTLKGDNVTELRVKFIRKIEDSVPPGDD